MRTLALLTLVFLAAAAYAGENELAKDLGTSCSSELKAYCANEKTYDTRLACIQKRPHALDESCMYFLDKHALNTNDPAPALGRTSTAITTSDSNAAPASEVSGAGDAGSSDATAAR